MRMGLKKVIAVEESALLVQIGLAMETTTGSEST